MLSLHLWEVPSKSRLTPAHISTWLLFSHYTCLCWDFSSPWPLNTKCLRVSSLDMFYFLLALSPLVISLLEFRFAPGLPERTSPSAEPGVTDPTAYINFRMHLQLNKVHLLKWIILRLHPLPHFSWCHSSHSLPNHGVILNVLFFILYMQSVSKSFILIIQNMDLAFSHQFHYL